MLRRTEVAEVLAAIQEDTKSLAETDSGSCDVWTDCIGDVEYKWKDGEARVSVEIDPDGDDPREIEYVFAIQVVLVAVTGLE